MSESLSGQIAVVTGGGRGIGRAISIELAKLGAKVIVNYSRSADAAEKVVSEIASAGGQAEAMCFDVADSESTTRALKEILENDGKIDILVNNAGIADDSLLVRTKDDQWDKTINVNLKGSFNTSRAVAKAMMKAKSGRIINISSVIGEMGNAGQAAYAASKAGVLGLTKSLAKELASRGVTVNAVTPGYIVTDMTDDMTDVAKEAVQNSIPLGRLGSSEDVAKLVGFLSSDSASYITGQVIGINGGLYI